MSQNIAQADYLYRLARSASATDRQVLAQAVTNILQACVTPDQLNLAQEILLILMNEADQYLREMLAKQLAQESVCPTSLLNYLIYENPLDVSAPLLRHSPALTDTDLIRAVKHFQETQYWCTIARRDRLGEDLAKVLMDTQDDQVIEILVKNPGTRFSKSSMDELVMWAEERMPMHKPLLMRPEVTPELASRVYWYANEDLQTEITQKFSVDSKMLEKTLDKIVTHRIAQKADGQPITPDLLDLSLQWRAQNRITARQIVDSLRKGETAFFCCLWAAWLDLDAIHVEKNLESNFMVTIAALSKAARVSRRDYNELFLGWRRLKMTNSVTNASEMATALRLYDKLTPEKAKQILLPLATTANHLPA